MFRRTSLLVLALAMLAASGCGTMSTVSSAITGRPTEYRFEDSVRCYYSQSGSLSCVQVR